LVPSVPVALEVRPVQVGLVVLLVPGVRRLRVVLHLRARVACSQLVLQRHLVVHLVPIDPAGQVVPSDLVRLAAHQHPVLLAFRPVQTHQHHPVDQAGLAGLLDTVCTVVELVHRMGALAAFRGCLGHRVRLVFQAFQACRMHLKGLVDQADSTLRIDRRSPPSLD